MMFTITIRSPNSLTLKRGNYDLTKTQPRFTFSGGVFYSHEHCSVGAIPDHIRESLPYRHFSFLEKEYLGDSEYLS